MNRLAAGLHGIAFFIALFVQTLQTPLAGAWLPFHLAGCALLLQGSPTPRRTLLWWATLAWLLAIVLAAFIIRPVSNGALQMWFLTAMPMLALCLHKDALPDYYKAFFVVFLIYALNLLVQVVLGVHYTTIDYRIYDTYTEKTWPLLDPNNAAAILNIGLIPSVWMATHKKKWWLVAGIFSLALISTCSKAGITAAVVASIIMLMYRYRLSFATVATLAGVALIGLLLAPDVLLVAIHGSVDARIPIWEASAPLALLQPLRGIGLGQFYLHYQHVRTEVGTAGFYAHNDLLQFVIEMGFPVALVFCLLAAAIARRTWTGNAVSGCVMLAVGLQALVEFQFYLPAISLALGVALAHHITNQKGSIYETAQDSQEL